MPTTRPVGLVGRVLLPVLFFALPVVSQAQSGWTPEQELKVKTIGAVRVSPDGKKVAYPVSAAVMTPDKSEFVSQIWVANSDGTGAVQLTYAEKSSVNPRWSPDGTKLAFRGPGEVAYSAFDIGELLSLAAGEAKNVEIALAAATRREGDLAAIGRPTRIN